MSDNFLQAKKSVLEKRADKSHEGQIDRHILKLCGIINDKDQYYTTSSCSGRIILLKDVEIKDKENFLFKSHDKISFSDLKKEIEKAAANYKGRVKFKFDACILHVACKDLVSAQKLYDKAKLSGWKRNGIQSSTNGRFVLELNSSERLEFPVLDKGKVLVSDEFLKIIVSESNKSFEKCWDKIKRLERVV